MPLLILFVTVPWTFSQRIRCSSRCNLCPYPVLVWWPSGDAHWGGEVHFFTRDRAVAGVCRVVYHGQHILGAVIVTVLNCVICEYLWLKLEFRIVKKASYLWWNHSWPGNRPLGPQALSQSLALPSLHRSTYSCPQIPSAGSTCCKSANLDYDNSTENC